MYLRRYRVTFAYREPTYERSVDGPIRLYRGSFVVAARTPEEAVAAARMELTWSTRRSGVSWVREMVWSSCEPLADDDG